MAVNVETMTIEQLVKLALEVGAGSMVNTGRDGRDRPVWLVLVAVGETARRLEPVIEQLTDEAADPAPSAAAPPATEVDRYRAAVLACMAAREVLREHDLPKLLREIERSHTTGPILDPTLYRQKAKAMDEDRELLRAALVLREFGGPSGG